MQRASLVAVVVFAAVATGCGGPTSDPKAGECQDYCDLILAHCVGGVAQYGDLNTCMATCEALPLGAPEVHTGNTIACRTFAAATAELDPMTCTKAGPGGDGYCGGNCESFCALADQLCTGDNRAFATVAACLSACDNYDIMPRYNTGEQSGDSFACRLYHLTAAASNPTTHCAHIGPDSPVCL